MLALALCGDYEEFIKKTSEKDILEKTDLCYR